MVRGQSYTLPFSTLNRNLLQLKLILDNFTAKKLACRTSATTYKSSSTSTYTEERACNCLPKLNPVDCTFLPLREPV